MVVNIALFVPPYVPVMSSHLAASIVDLQLLGMGFSILYIQFLT